MKYTRKSKENRPNKLWDPGNDWRKQALETDPGAGG